jgi:hypothetical protein
MNKPSEAEIAEALEHFDNNIWSDWQGRILSRAYRASQERGKSWESSFFEMQKWRDMCREDLSKAKSKLSIAEKALESDLVDGHDISCQYGTDINGQGDAISECSDICIKKNDALSKIKGS